MPATTRKAEGRKKGLNGLLCVATSHLSPTGVASVQYVKWATVATAGRLDAWMPAAATHPHS